MYRSEAVEEYARALKEGQKEYKECMQKEVTPNPVVLDELLGQDTGENCVSVGLVEIPMRRIIGVKSAGRVSAFSPTFRPLMKGDTEFAAKWIALCAAHLGEEGIQNPIECFEYLGDFYVQEGNKRVSVLRHFGAARMSAHVKRILPAQLDTPRVKAYNEFLDFYKRTGLYDVQYTTPGNYAKLLNAMQIPADREWTEEDRRRFRAYFHYFTEALESAGSSSEKPQPEDALLMWLEVHPFAELGTLSAGELKKTVQQLWPNLLAVSAPEPVVKTEPPTEKNVIVQLLKGVDYLNVAFIHQNDAKTSHWTQAHEGGRKYLEEALGEAVSTKAYFHANTPEQAEKLIGQAVEEGADVVFTTAPQLIAPCMKGSVKYPKVRFLNCSVYQPYASVRTYYSRIYEGKFITGTIAGAMCKDGRIGYVGSYPTHGVSASINAFALGAQMTNPNAKIELRWACVPGNPTWEMLNQGIRVISNQETPSSDGQMFEYGTYLADDDGHLLPLASPWWMWGQFYENVVRSIMKGNWEDERAGQIVNLWWGMRSGVIDVVLSSDLPEGVRVLANMLKDGICNGTLDPFARKIIDQQGNIRNDGSRTFTPMEILQMDWLCENVIGAFPSYDQLLPNAKTMVDLMGLPSVTGEVLQT